MRFDPRALQQALAPDIVDDTITNTLIVQGGLNKVENMIFRYCYRRPFFAKHEDDNSIFRL